MALVVKDRVKETTTTTGTGAISLGGAVSKFVTFSSVLSNGDTTYYSIEHLGTANEFEVGIGTYTSSGNTLTRTTILASSNSNNAVDFSAGTKNIFITYPADKAVYEDASGNVSGVGTLNATNVVASNLMQASAITLTGSIGVSVTENIIFEGTTADNYETFFTATDPTADRTITLPDATGTVALTSDINATNVTAAGALMDSEVTNLAQVKAFDSSDYATAAQGTTADAALPKSGGTMTGNITMSGSQTVDGRDLSVDGAKLDGIEASATADQTAAEIRTLVESASDSNVFTDADHSKLNAIEANATADQTASEILTAVKTVDGASSGLDADLLDGQEGSYYTNAANLTGTLPAISGANLTGVQAASVNVTESSDDNVDYNVLFSDTANSGTVQMTPTQDDGGLTFNPNTNRLYSAFAQHQQVGIDSYLYHNGDTNTWLIFDANDSIKLGTDGTARLHITNSGLDVTGNITVSGTVDGKDVSTLTTATAAADEATALAIALG